MANLQRILYVEDDPDVQTIARLALELTAGFTVKLCSSGDEAVREAAAFAPDLILIDMMMPGMDGLATLAALQAQPELAGVPMAFMTAKVQPAEIAYYTARGARAVIAKPFNPMLLAQQVRDIWLAAQTAHP